MINWFAATLVIVLIFLNTATLVMEIMQDFDKNMKIILVRTNLIVMMILLLIVGTS